MPAKGVVPVPASSADVRGFIDQYRSAFEQALIRVRELIDTLRKTDPDLRSVYKIYSRGEIQGLDELKSARKIRLKFNEYNGEKAARQASLFNTPDIVGLTLVVPYPSNISSVSAALDRIIDKRDLDAVNMGAGDPDTGIITKHGRALGKNGYLACHYNVRVRGVQSSARPIVEIQIKTLLHDAWGAKTHDLTYKPAGRIGEELLESFDLLGTNLANLDRQSDALRSSILRAASVRDRKRRAVQVAILDSIAQAANGTVEDDTLKAEAEKLRRTILTMNPETLEPVSDPVARRLLDIFNDKADVPGSGVAASTLLCLVAAVTRQPLYFEHARDTLEHRLANETDTVRRLAIRLDGCLAPFAGGDLAETIDEAEEVEREIARIVAAGETTSDPERFERIRLNVLSNLAYFHADIVGSHEGQKRNSAQAATDYNERVKVLYGGVGFPPAGIWSKDDEITKAVKSDDERFAAEVFFALDNEAYVGVQCAKDEAQLRAVKQRLEFLHTHKPPSAAELASLAIDYHDYCARVRLAELESVLLP